METLAGQAFGAADYRTVGVVLQRAVVLTTLISAALAGLWCKAEDLLLLTRQDPAIAEATACYLVRMIPALYCVGLVEAFKR